MAESVLGRRVQTKRGLVDPSPEIQQLSAKQRSLRIQVQSGSNSIKVKIRGLRQERNRLSHAMRRLCAGACLDRGAGGARHTLASKKKKKKKNAATAPARALRHVPRFDYVHARTCHVHVTLHIMSVCLYDCRQSDCSVWAHSSEVGQKSCQSPPTRLESRLRILVQYTPRLRLVYELGAACSLSTRCIRYGDF